MEKLGGDAQSNCFRSVEIDNQLVFREAWIGRPPGFSPLRTRPVSGTAFVHANRCRCGRNFRYFRFIANCCEYCSLHVPLTRTVHALARFRINSLEFVNLTNRYRYLWKEARLQASEN